MKVDNRSGIPTKALRLIVEFVSRRAPGTVMTRLRLLDGQPGRVSGGLAEQYHPSQENPHPTAPSLVTLWLSSPASMSYPRIEQHVQELPRVTLDSWDEEVLLVLAHELKHIADFWDPIVDVDPYELEVRAEAFAIDALEDWREFRASKVPRLEGTANVQRAA